MAWSRQMDLSNFASAETCVSPRSSTCIRAYAAVNLFATATATAIALLALPVATAGGNADSSVAVVTARSAVEEGEVLVLGKDRSAAEETEKNGSRDDPNPRGFSEYYVLESPY